MALQAYGKKIIVRRDDTPTREGAIFLPDDVKKTPTKGKIVSLGSEIDTSTLKVGQTVHFQKYAGTEIVSGKDTVVILSVDDILATE